MNCAEATRLLDAYSDGELDLLRHLELEAHLRECAACARAADNVRARSAALQSGNLTRFAAPASLSTRIRQSLPKPDAASKKVRHGWFAWGQAGLAAGLAASLAIGYIWGGANARLKNVAEEAVADHVRSLMVGHLMDVASTDQHTVKPWFAGKLDFSPPVVDLSAAGFPLIGGRLDEINRHPAAALVYRRRQHAINVFIWPADSGRLSDRHYSRDGYQVEAWTHAGFNFIAVSEIPAAELASFSSQLKSHLP